MSGSNEEVLDLTTIDNKSKEVARKILEEDDIDKVKDLTALFNLNAQKRNVMRVIKMNDLLDKVTNQISDRFEKYPDNFTNDELLKYMQVTEAAIDRANKNLNLIEETPQIAMQQNNQVNINMTYGIDEEGRGKVLDIINSVLKFTRTSTNDGEDNITNGNNGNNT